MKTRIRFAAALVAALAPAAAMAAIDFNTPAISQPVTVGAIETIVSKSANTSAIGAVTQAPSGDLYAVHVDSTNNETIFRVNPATATGTAIATDSAIGTALGAPYSTTLIFEGGFETSPGFGAIYFGESFSGEYALISVNPGTGAPTQVLRSADLADSSDFAVLPTGEIVVVRGGAGVGIVSGGTYTPKITEAQLIALLPATVPALPPESLAVNPTNGDVWLFCHDELEIFRVQNITSPTPIITRVVIPGWTGVVDLHDMGFDSDGNLYGFDEAAGAIVIWDGTSTYDVPFTEIATALGGGLFEASLWRGITVRTSGTDQADVFLASANSNYGIVRLRFTAGSSVSDWNLYN